MNNDCTSSQDVTLTAQAALCRSFAILIVFINGGFVLQRTSEHPWWIWGFWVSPLQYSQNAICASLTIPLLHLRLALV